MNSERGPYTLRSCRTMFVPELRRLDTCRRHEPASSCCESLNTGATALSLTKVKALSIAGGLL